MDDRQFSVPAASTDRAAGSDFKALVSAIERSGINAMPQFTFATATPTTPWARANNDADIETEILEWIISHVPRARRSKVH